MGIHKHEGLSLGAIHYDNGHTDNDDNGDDTANNNVLNVRELME